MLILWWFSCGNDTNNLFNCPNKNDTNNLKLQACLLEIDLIYERSCTCNAFSTRIKLASNVVVVVVYIYGLITDSDKFYILIYQ